MTLTRRQTQLLGLATAWPPIYFVLFLVVWLIAALGMTSLIASTAGGPPDPDLVTGFMGTFMAGFAVVFVLHALTMLLMVVNLALYLVIVIKDTRLTDNERVMWAILVVIGGFIAQGIYFLTKLWPPPHPADDLDEDAA